MGKRDFGLSKPMAGILCILEPAIAVASLKLEPVAAGIRHSLIGMLQPSGNNGHNLI